LCGEVVQLGANLLVGVAHLLKEVFVVPVRGTKIRVLVACVLREFAEDFQLAPHEGLGLSEAVSGLQQKGEVVEADGNVGMLGAVSFLGNDLSAAHEGFGLGLAVGRLQQLGEVVKADGDVWVVGP
jgi:hypothetical protein